LEELKKAQEEKSLGKVNVSAPMQQQTVKSNIVITVSLLGLIAIIGMFLPLSSSKNKQNRT